MMKTDPTKRPNAADVLSHPALARYVAATLPLAPLGSLAREEKKVVYKKLKSAVPTTVCTDSQGPEIKAEATSTTMPGGTVSKPETELDEELKREGTDGMAQTEAEKDACMARMGTLVTTPVFVRPDLRVLREFVVTVSGGEKDVVVGIMKPRGNKEISVIRETTESVVEDDTDDVNEGTGAQ